MRKQLILVLLVLGACSSPPGTGKGKDANAIGNTKLGRAHVQLSGSYSSAIDLPIDNQRSQLHAPPGGFALFWASGSNLISMGGITFNGTRKTSSTLAFGFLWVKGTTVVSKTSSKGECTITMHASGASVTGSFTCGHLVSNGKPYAAQGTFSASA